MRDSQIVYSQKLFWIVAYIFKSPATTDNLGLVVMIFKNQKIVKSKSKPQNHQFFFCILSFYSILFLLRKKIHQDAKFCHQQNNTGSTNKTTLVSIIKSEEK
jgi:hypothetical protein